MIVSARGSYILHKKKYESDLTANYKGMEIILLLLGIKQDCPKIERRDLSLSSYECHATKYCNYL